jgi:hypothetical protein
MLQTRAIARKVRARTRHLSTQSWHFQDFVRKQRRKNPIVFDRAIRGMETTEVLADFDEVVQNIESLKTTFGLHPHTTGTDPQPSRPAYVVSSWFLWDCYKWLTRVPEEELCFVTGVELDGRFHLQRRSEFKLAMQSWGGVEADTASMTKALLEMDKYGHRFLAHFHSHPFTGKGGTCPSATDRNFQSRLETGKYPVIGGIFSRDGYVRFFANDKAFNVEVFGKGVDKVEKDVFRLIASE